MTTSGYASDATTADSAATTLQLPSAFTMPHVTRAITICNSLGLHARPAMQFVDLANQFTSSITVHKDGAEATSVDGKSVMQMITLEASQGTALRIEAEGEDAEQAVEQLAKLVADKFGEE
jgi:phosphocarrier protein